MEEALTTANDGFQMMKENLALLILDLMIGQNNPIKTLKLCWMNLRLQMKHDLSSLTKKFPGGPSKPGRWSINCMRGEREYFLQK